MIDNFVYKQYEDFFIFFKDLMIDNQYGDIDSYIFRGQKNDNWELIPYALREDGQNTLKKIHHYEGNIKPKLWPWVEAMAVCMFYKKANINTLNLPAIEELIATTDNELPDFFNPMGKRVERKYYELFALAQHYRIPTRFMDWTYDLLIALYFAISDIYDNNLVKNNDKLPMFSIWMLDINAIKRCDEYNINLVTPRYSINPNLAAQKGILSYISLKGDFEDLELPEKQIKLEEEDNIQHIPFEDIIKTSTFYDPMPTKKEEDRKKLEIPILYKFTFPIYNLSKIKKFLFNMGYTKSRIFPGFQNTVEDLLSDTIQ